MDRLDMDIVRAAIGEWFPSLASLGVVPLGEGTDHAAYEVGGRFVFRFPRHPESAEGLDTEARLMEWLAPQLPVPVPRYVFRAGGYGATVPPFAGYERLPGRPAMLVPPRAIDADGVGRTLGAFLRTLHSCDATAAAALGVSPDDDPTYETWSADALADVRFACARGYLDARRASRWQQVLALPPATRDVPPLLIHGDFAAEHALLDDDGTVAGIIDWSDAALGDPARDLAGLYHWANTDLLAAALDAYADADAAARSRARWFAACRAVADIAFGETRHRREYVAAGLRALDFLEHQGALPR